MAATITNKVGATSTSNPTVTASQSWTAGSRGLVAVATKLTTNAAVIAYCSANSITPWYVNLNPTPSDISDKSGAGHDPAWLNANRPTLWEG